MFVNFYFVVVGSSKEKGSKLFIKNLLYVIRFVCFFRRVIFININSNFIILNLEIVLRESVKYVFGYKVNKKES